MSKLKQPIRPSKMRRAHNCPVSVWREQQMPPTPDSPDATEGTLLHAEVKPAFLGQPSLTVLNDSQMGAIRACVGFLNQFVETGDRVEFEYELPMYYGESRLTHVDAVVLKGTPPTDAVIVDFKMLYGILPFPAARDLQLWTYTVSLHAQFETIKTIVAHRFHPRLWDEHRESSVTFADDWEAYRSVIRDIIDTCKSIENDPTALGKPGGWCEYCEAQLACDEFLGQRNMPVLLEEKELTVQHISRILTYEVPLGLLTTAMKKAKEMAIKIIQDGGDIPGYTLKDGRKTRTIPDYRVVQERLKGIMPQDGIDSAIKISVASLEKAHKAATGLKGKPASVAFSAELGDLIETKEGAPTLTRKKEE